MILVAKEKDVSEVVEHISPLENYRIDGIVLTERNAEGETICNIPVVANLDNAAKYLCRERVDEVLICNYSFGQESSPVLQPEIYSEGEVSAVEESVMTESRRVEEFAARCIEMAIPIHFRIPVPESNLGGKNFLDRRIFLPDHDSELRDADTGIGKETAGYCRRTGRQCSGPSYHDLCRTNYQDQKSRADSFQAVEDWPERETISDA